MEQAIEAVFTHSQSKGSVRLLLTVIAHHIPKDSDRCQVSKEVLCAQTGIDFRCIGRYITQLESAGEIKVIRGGGRLTNTYVLLIPIQGCAAKEKSATRRRRGIGGLRNVRAKNNQRLRDWRADVLDRDGYVCQKCQSNEHLAAHHIKPFAEFPNLRFDVENGITLCQECHNALHDSSQKELS